MEFTSITNHNLISAKLCSMEMYNGNKLVLINSYIDYLASAMNDEVRIKHLLNRLIYVYQLNITEIKSEPEILVPQPYQFHIRCCDHISLVCIFEVINNFSICDQLLARPVRALCPSELAFTYVVPHE